MKLKEKLFSIIVCFISGTIYSVVLYQVISNPVLIVGIFEIVGVIFLQVAVVVSFSLMVYIIFEERIKKLEKKK